MERRQRVLNLVFGLNEEMKIISWNVNGIRACIRKGFWDWYDSCDPDVVCLQETKITEADFLKLEQNHRLTPLNPNKRELKLTTNNRKHPIYFAIAPAKRRGYSGVAVLTKHKPRGITIGLGREAFDHEGRTLFVDFGKFILVNTYFPNGGRDLARIPFKLEYADYFLKKLEQLRKRQKNLVLCGDFNVAHTESDIKNPVSNKNNSGFTPIEREWFTKFLRYGYSDIYRDLYPEARDSYTWWSFRPGVRERNIGWRIDYFIVTPQMKRHVIDAGIHMDVMGSDHCPVSLTVKIESWINQRKKE